MSRVKRFCGMLMLLASLTAWNPGAAQAQLISSDTTIVTESEITNNTGDAIDAPYVEMINVNVQNLRGSVVTKKTTLFQAINTLIANNESTLAKDNETVVKFVNSTIVNNKADNFKAVSGSAVNSILYSADETSPMLLYSVSNVRSAVSPEDARNKYVDDLSKLYLTNPSTHAGPGLETLPVSAWQPTANSPAVGLANPDSYLEWDWYSEVEAYAATDLFHAYADSAARVADRGVNLNGSGWTIYTAGAINAQGMIWGRIPEGEVLGTADQRANGIAVYVSQEGSGSGQAISDPWPLARVQEIVDAVGTDSPVYIYIKDNGTYDFLFGLGAPEGGALFVVAGCDFSRTETFRGSLDAKAGTTTFTGGISCATPSVEAEVVLYGAVVENTLVAETIAETPAGTAGLSVINSIVRNVRNDGNRIAELDEMGTINLIGSLVYANSANLIFRNIEHSTIANNHGRIEATNLIGGSILWNNDTDVVMPEFVVYTACDEDDFETSAEYSNIRVKSDNCAGTPATNMNMHQSLYVCFNNPSAGDYTLGEGSICINRGHKNTRSAARQITVDINGVERRVHGWDMGAYESSFIGNSYLSFMPHEVNLAAIDSAFTYGADSILVNGQTGVVMLASMDRTIAEVEGTTISGVRVGNTTVMVVGQSPDLTRFAHPKPGTIVVNVAEKNVRTIEYEPAVVGNDIEWIVGGGWVNLRDALTITPDVEEVRMAPVEQGYVEIRGDYVRALKAFDDGQVQFSVSIPADETYEKLYATFDMPAPLKAFGDVTLPRREVITFGQPSIELNPSIIGDGQLEMTVQSFTFSVDTFVWNDTEKVYEVATIDSTIFDPIELEDYILVRSNRLILKAAGVAKIVYSVSETDNYEASEEKGMEVIIRKAQAFYNMPALGSYEYFLGREIECAVIGAEDAPVMFQLDTAVATINDTKYFEGNVNEAIKIKMVAPGTTLVGAYVLATRDYEGMELAQSLTLEAGEPGIPVVGFTTTYQYWGPSPRNAFDLPDTANDGSIVTWISSDTTIARITDNNHVEILGAGHVVFVGQANTQAETIATATVYCTFIKNIQYVDTRMALPEFTVQTPVDMAPYFAAFEYDKDGNRLPLAIQYPSNARVILGTDDITIAEFKGTNLIVKKALPFTIFATALETANCFESETFFFNVTEEMIHKIKPVLEILPVADKTYGDPDFTLICRTNSNGFISFGAETPDTITVHETRGTVSILTTGEAVVCASVEETDVYETAHVCDTFMIAPAARYVTFNLEPRVVIAGNQAVLTGGAVYPEGTFSYALDTTLTPDLDAEIWQGEMGETFFRADTPGVYYIKLIVDNDVRYAQPTTIAMATLEVVARPSMLTLAIPTMDLSEIGTITPTLTNLRTLTSDEVLSDPTWGAVTYIIEEGADVVTLDTPDYANNQAVNVIPKKAGTAQIRAIWSCKKFTSSNGVELPYYPTSYSQVYTLTVDKVYPQISVMAPSDIYVGQNFQPYVVFSADIAGETNVILPEGTIGYDIDINDRPYLVLGAGNTIYAVAGDKKDAKYTIISHETENFYTTSVTREVEVHRLADTITFDLPDTVNIAELYLYLQASSVSGNAITFTTEQTDSLAITGNVGRMLNVGYVGVTAATTGSDQYQPAAVTDTVYIEKADGIVIFEQFGPLPFASEADFPNNIHKLNAYATDGSDITYTSMDTAIAVITDSEGIEDVDGDYMKVLAIGTVGITATSAGTDVTEPDSKTVYVTITREIDDFLDLSSVVTLYTYDSERTDVVYDLPAKSVRGYDVSYTSTDTRVIVIEGTTFRVVGAGKAIISGQTSDYNATPVRATTLLTVIKAKPVIIDTGAFVASTTWVVEGQYDLLRLFSVKDPAERPMFTYDVTDPTIAEIVNGHFIRIHKAGERFTIVVHALPTVNYGAAIEFFTMGAASKIDNEVVFAPVVTPVTYEKGLVIPLRAFSIKGVPVDFVSSDSVNLPITGDLAEVKGVGEYVITAIAPETANYNEARDSQTLVVVRADAGLVFEPVGPYNYTANESAHALVAYTNPDNNAAITFVSQNPEVVEIVDSTFVIRGVGTTLIEAHSAETANYNSAVAYQSVTIERVDGDQDYIELTALQGTMNFVYGQADSVTDLPATSYLGRPIVYTAENPYVCEVKDTQLIPKNAGQTLVIAETLSDGNYSGTKSWLLVNIRKAQNTITGDFKDLQLTVDSHVSLMGYLTANEVNPNDPTAFEFSVLNLTADVNNGHELAVLDAGEIDLFVRIVETRNYRSVTGRYTLPVGKNHQTITFVPFTTPKTYGEPDFPLFATATSGLTVRFEASDTEMVEIDAQGNIVRILSAMCDPDSAARDVTIYAIQDGNEKYFAADSVARVLTINRAEQQIFFDIPTRAVCYDDAIELNGSATSNLPVRYTSSDTTVAEVVVYGGIPHLKVGRTGAADITAYQDGDSNFLPAPQIDRTVHVDAKEQWFTVDSAQLYYTYAETNSAFDIAAEAGIVASSNLPLTFTSNNSDVIRIDGTSMIIGNAGEAKITVEQRGDSNYYSAATTTVITVHVAKINRNVQWVTEDDQTITVGQSVALIAAVDVGEDEAEYVYSLDSDIDPTDAFIVKNPDGTATLRVKENGEMKNIAVMVKALESTNYYETSKAIIHFNTDKLYMKLVNTNLDPTFVYHYDDEPLYVNAEVDYLTLVTNADGKYIHYSVIEQIPAYDTVRWGDSGVATITDTGWLQFTGVGYATINLHVDGDETYYDFDYPITIRVDSCQTDEIRGMIDNPTIVQITDSHLKLTAYSAHDKDADIEYFLTENNDPRKPIAEIEVYGEDTVLAFYNVGNTMLHAQTAVRPFHEIAKAQVNVIVRRSEQFLRFTPEQVTDVVYEQGFVIPLTAQSGSRDSVLNMPWVEGANNTARIEYFSDNTNVIAIEGHNAIVKGAGQAVITAKQIGSDFYNPAEPVSVTLIVRKAEQVITWAPDTELKVVGIDGDLSESIAKLDATALEGAGLEYILVEGTDLAGFYMQDVTTRVITPETQGKVEASSFVGKDAFLVAQRTGTVTVVVKATESANYNRAEAIYTFTIDKNQQKVEIHPSIVNNANGIDVFYFEYTNNIIDLSTFVNQTLPAARANPGKAEYSYDRPITYTSSNADVATVTPEGIVTIIARGVTEITATQVGDENYQADSATFEIRVERVKPTVTWKNFAELYNLYTLDQLQLDVSSAYNEHPTNGAIHYDSSDTQIASVDENGLLTVHQVGLVTITVWSEETEQFFASDPVSYSFETWTANEQNIAQVDTVYVQQYGVGKGDGSSAENATGSLEFALNAAPKAISVAEGTLTKEHVNARFYTRSSPYYDARIAELNRLVINDALYIGYDVNTSFTLRDGISMVGGQAIVPHSQPAIYVVDNRAPGYSTLDAQSEHVVLYAGAKSPYDKFNNVSFVEKINFVNGFAKLGHAAAMTVPANCFVNNCRFFNNVSEFNGGAVSIKGNGVVANSYFLRNAATVSGGAVAMKDKAVLVNCVLADNYSASGATAVYIEGGTPYFVNNTVVGNRGGHTDPIAVGTAGVKAKIYNSVLWSNGTAFDGNITALYCAVEGAFTGEYSIGLSAENEGKLPPYTAEDLEANEFAPFFANVIYDGVQDPVYNVTENSLLINRANKAIFLEATHFTEANIDQALDIAGQPRLSKGHLDIGAFESAEMGWLIITAKEQEVVYNGEEQPYVNYDIDPNWNVTADSITKIVYKGQNTGVEIVSMPDDRKAPVNADNYEVTLTAAVTEPEINNWHTTEAVSQMLTVNKHVLGELVWSDNNQVEWDKAQHALTVTNLDELYDRVEDQQFRITYESNLIWNGAEGTTYPESVIAPTEPGVYTVRFYNENVNYLPEATVAHETVATLTIYPRMVTGTNFAGTEVDSVYVTVGGADGARDLTFTYDQKPHEVFAFFNMPVIPGDATTAPVDPDDYDILYTSAEDPARDVTAAPIGIGTYTVEVRMKGNKNAPETLVAGHYDGSYFTTMTIVSDDPYAQDIPVYVEELPFKEIVLDGDKTIDVTVVAKERIPQAGQTIKMVMSWTYAADIAGTSGQTKTVDYVFDGTSDRVTMTHDLTYNGSYDMTRVVRFMLYVRGDNPDAETGLNLRSVTPTYQTLTVYDSKTENPSNVVKNTERSGFVQKATVVKGFPPVYIRFYVAGTENTTVRLGMRDASKYNEQQEYRSKKEFQFALDGDATRVTFDPATRYYTMTDVTPGYHYLVFTPFNDYRPYTAYRTYEVFFKDFTRAGATQPMAINTHRIRIVSDNPRTSALTSSFVVTDKSQLDVCRYIGLFGMDNDNETMRTYPAHLKDVLDGALLDNGLTEEEYGHTVLALSLTEEETDVTDTPTTYGRVEFLYGKRVFCYYLDPEKVTDSMLKNGFVDEFPCFVFQSGAGTSYATVYIHIAAGSTYGSTFEVAATQFAPTYTSFAANPSAKGYYYQPYKKASLNPKTTQISMRRVGSAKGLATAQFALKTSLPTYNKKTLNADKTAFYHDTLAADDEQLVLRKRVGVELQAKAKIPGQKKATTINAGSMVIVPPQIESVTTGYLPRWTGGHWDGRIDPKLQVALYVEGNFFGTAPKAYMQYKNPKNGKIVKVTGHVRYNNGRTDFASMTTDQGGTIAVPLKKGYTGDYNSKMVVTFPKDYNTLNRAKKTGSDTARVDIVIESRCGIGTMKDIFNMAAAPVVEPSEDPVEDSSEKPTL